MTAAIQMMVAESSRGERGNLKEAARPRAMRVFCRFSPLLLVLWVLLVLYPNPLSLPTSVRRLATPSGDHAAVGSLAKTTPTVPEHQRTHGFGNRAWSVVLTLIQR
jgi:hypothetical protein